MLENAIDVTERCRHCLMCRHVCPVGNLTRVETLTPHGWAQLVALERRDLSTWNAETVDALYKCADCGNCRSHCVYSNPLPEGIAAARAQVVERGLAPAIVYEMAEILGKWENPYLPRRPEKPTGSGDVALFVGDEAHLLKPALVTAAVELLRAVGIDPVLIGRGRSTGYLASSLGLPALAYDHALANLGELEACGASRLFVLSPGEYFAFTQMYDERLGLRVPENVEVLELVPFLAAQLEAGRLRLKRASANGGPVAYVDPTHAVRVKSRFPAPRRLLDAVLPEPARELFWRDGRAYPCGDLALQFTQPQIADALTQARLVDAAQVGARIVVTEGAGSLAHLERHAAEHGIEVKGLYELLVDHLEN
ncbi:MAG TPA: (Fe-S)-binding protein [Longimicrobiaceae bacterium]